MRTEPKDGSWSEREAARSRGGLSRFEASRRNETREPNADEAIEPPAAPERPPGERADGELRSPRVRVDDEGVQRPFMLGILVHSLTESGLTFEDAYSVARQVWSRIRERALVTKAELRELVRERTGPVGHEARVSSEPATVAVGGPLAVLGPDGRWPFSQAKLHQSFLAAGLDPRRAFDLVSTIEWQLRRLGNPVVPRDAIRELADSLLTERLDRATAERYRAWRQFQNHDDRPVIVLLGGTSGVGKSSLAVEVARRLSIGRVLSTDSIRDVMRVMLSDDLVPTLHVSSFEAHKRLIHEPAAHVDPVIEGFLEQARTVAVGVRAVLERAILEGTSMVLDGVVLAPGIVDPHEWSERAHVVFLVAADLDRESLHGHLIARADGPGTRASERYVRNFQEIFRIQEHLLEGAQQLSIPIVDVQDLESAAEQVVKHVVDGLGDARPAKHAPVD